MRRPHDLNKAYSLLLNREIGRRILEDPRLVEAARLKLSRMTESHERAAVAIWSNLLAQPPSFIADVLSRDDAESDYVRETRPAFIALEIETRNRLLEEARMLAVTRR